MITSLLELNGTVNGIANHIVQTVCTQTKDGSFRLSLDDIDRSCLPHCISGEDLYAYGDFIAAELATRKEFETIDCHDHEFSGYCRREYCPNLEDRRPEEPLFQVAQPLSMTELSEIGKTAISKFDTSLSDLRDTLGMDYLQVRQLGLACQPHFFTVESPDIDKPFWSEDIDSILHHMKTLCETGAHPKLYYNAINSNHETMRLPLAEERCGKIASISTAPEHRPKDAEYIKAAQKVEGAVYDLPRGYGLSYIIKTPNNLDLTPLTLKDAVARFPETAKNAQPLVLTACLNAPDGKQFPEAVILVQTQDRIFINAHADPDSPFQPRRGSFYPNLAQLAFPDRVLDIDHWRVRVVAPGEQYGRGDHQTNNDFHALVEFRDMNGVSSASPNGVLVATYPIDALIGAQGRGGLQPNQSLNLYDGVESWTLSVDELTPVLSWLHHKETELNKEKNADLDHKIQGARVRSEMLQKKSYLSKQPEFQH